MPGQIGVPCDIAIPQVFHDGPVDMDLVRRHVETAEEMGYHGIWVQERFIGESPTLEGLSLLSYVAALTKNVRLGTSVVVAPNHNPVHLAKQFSTIDQMSQGRLTIGLGLGGRPQNDNLMGGATERRVRYFVEGLQVMKALWQEPKANHHGHFWNLEDVEMEPKPVQKPHPPVWFGGRHPNALIRAVRHGNGWMGAGSSSTEQFKQHVATLQETMESTGRDPATFAISKRIYLAIDDNEARAEGRLREWFGRHYGNTDMGSQVSVWGSASHCAEALAEIVDGGAQMLMLNPVFDHMEHLDGLKQALNFPDAK